MSFDLPRSTPRPPRVMPNQGHELCEDDQRQVVRDLQTMPYRKVAEKWGLSVGSVQRMKAKVARWRREGRV